MSGQRREPISAIYLLVAAVIAAVVVATIAAQVAGTVSFWWLPFVAITLGATLNWPDSHAGTLLYLLLGAMWFVSVPDPYTPWVLPAAMAFLLLHTALGYWSAAGPAAAVSSSALLAWAGPVAAVAAVTAATWGLATGLHAGRIRGSVVASLVAMAILLAVLWIVRSKSLPDKSAQVRP